MLSKSFFSDLEYTYKHIFLKPINFHTVILFRTKSDGIVETRRARLAFLPSIHVEGTVSMAATLSTMSRLAKQVTRSRNVRTWNNRRRSHRTKLSLSHNISAKCRAGPWWPSSNAVQSNAKSLGLSGERGTMSWSSDSWQGECQRWPCSGCPECFSGSHKWGGVLSHPCMTLYPKLSKNDAHISNKNSSALTGYVSSLKISWHIVLFHPTGHTQAPYQACRAKDVFSKYVESVLTKCGKLRSLILDLQKNYSEDTTAKKILDYKLVAINLQQHAMYSNPH